MDFGKFTCQCFWPGQFMHQHKFKDAIHKCLRYWIDSNFMIMWLETYRSGGHFNGFLQSRRLLTGTSFVYSHHLHLVGLILLEFCDGEWSLCGRHCPDLLEFLLAFLLNRHRVFLHWCTSIFLRLFPLDRDTWFSGLLDCQVLGRRWSVNFDLCDSGLLCFLCDLFSDHGFTGRNFWYLLNSLLSDIHLNQRPPINKTSLLRITHTYQHNSLCNYWWHTSVPILDLAWSKTRSLSTNQLIRVVMLTWINFDYKLDNMLEYLLSCRG